MKGVSADALPSYLDERMWRDRWGKTTEDAFNNLCAHIHVAEHVVYSVEECQHFIKFVILVSYI
jgi:hypothetical protein